MRWGRQTDMLVRAMPYCRQMLPTIMKSPAMQAHHTRKPLSWLSCSHRPGLREGEQHKPDIILLHAWCFAAPTSMCCTGKTQLKPLGEEKRT